MDSASEHSARELSLLVKEALNFISLNFDNIQLQNYRESSHAEENLLRIFSDTLQSLDEPLFQRLSAMLSVNNTVRIYASDSPTSATESTLLSNQHRIVGLLWDSYQFGGDNIYRKFDHFATRVNDINKDNEWFKSRGIVGDSVEVEGDVEENLRTFYKLNCVMLSTVVLLMNEIMKRNAVHQHSLTLSPGDKEVFLGMYNSFEPLTWFSWS